MELVGGYTRFEHCRRKAHDVPETVDLLDARNRRRRKMSSPLGEGCHRSSHPSDLHVPSHHHPSALSSGHPCHPYLPLGLPLSHRVPCRHPYHRRSRCHHHHQRNRHRLSRRRDSSYRVLKRFGLGKISLATNSKRKNVVVLVFFLNLTVVGRAFS